MLQFGIHQSRLDLAGCFQEYLLGICPFIFQPVLPWKAVALMWIKQGLYLPCRVTSVTFSQEHAALQLEKQGCVYYETYLRLTGSKC